jgi:glycosyltransferase involved in cell wall biosynthesis
MKTSVVAIVQNLEQPRERRRVRAMARHGFRVRVYGFYRELYGSKQIHPDIETVNLGNPGFHVSVRRILILFNAARKIRKLERGRHVSFIYCFGFDSLLINYLAFPHKLPFGYEISDLIFWKGMSTFANILCYVEDFFLRHASIITLTSPFFEEELASRVPQIDQKFLVLENKIPPEIISSLLQPKLEPYPFQQGRLRIGFMGKVKYIDLFKRIIDGVAERSDSFELHIFGHSLWLDEVTEYVSKYNNIFYHGAFENPEDLPKVFSAMELSLIVYDSSDYNVRVAIPNKLFESIYFRVPILASVNTALGKRVQQWQVGFTIDDQSPEAIDQFLESVTREDLTSVRQSMDKHGTENLIVDMQPLFQRIENVVA